jgi:hypothetical protein
MSRSQGSFTEVEPDFRNYPEHTNAPTQELPREELSGEAQAIVRDVERRMTARPTTDPSSNLEATGDREAAALAVEAGQRKKAMDFAVDHHGEFNYEDRLTSPSVHVHRPDRWPLTMQERFRGIVRYLYEHDGIRFPLDKTMDDVQRGKYQKIIDEVCDALDAQYKPESSHGEVDDEQKAA